MSEMQTHLTATLVSSDPRQVITRAAPAALRMCLVLSLSPKRSRTLSKMLSVPFPLSPTITIGDPITSPPAATAEGLNRRVENYAPYFTMATASERTNERADPGHQWKPEDWASISTLSGLPIHSNKTVVLNDCVIKRQLRPRLLTEIAAATISGRIMP